MRDHKRYDTRPSWPKSYHPAVPLLSRIGAPVKIHPSRRSTPEIKWFHLTTLGVIYRNCRGQKTRIINLTHLSVIPVTNCFYNCLLWVFDHSSLYVCSDICHKIIGNEIIYRIRKIWNFELNERFGLTSYFHVVDAPLLRVMTFYLKSVSSMGMTSFCHLRNWLWILIKYIY